MLKGCNTLYERNLIGFEGHFLWIGIRFGFQRLVDGSYNQHLGCCLTDVRCLGNSLTNCFYYLLLLLFQHSTYSIYISSHSAVEYI